MFILRWLRSDSHFPNWGVFLFAVIVSVATQVMGRTLYYKNIYSQGHVAGQKAELVTIRNAYYLVNKDTCPNTNYCIVEVRK